MKEDKKVDNTRRGLVIASCSMGGVAGIAATGVLVSSLKPSGPAKKEVVTADIHNMKPKEIRIVNWQGKKVWMMKRSEDMLASLDKTQSLVADPDSKRTNYAATPAYAQNPWRSIKKDLLVFVPTCTHLGCAVFTKLDAGLQPGLPADWQGGFFCPCHGSTFDLAGRVFKDKPASDNLEVPPYYYVDDNTITIGDDAPANKVG